jgi:hypothetical protein
MPGRMQRRLSPPAQPMHHGRPHATGYNAGKQPVHREHISRTERWLTNGGVLLLSVVIAILPAMFIPLVAIAGNSSAIPIGCALAGVDSFICACVLAFNVTMLAPGRWMMAIPLTPGVFWWLWLIFQHATITHT